MKNSNIERCHRVLTRDPHPQSMAALILLNRKLRPMVEGDQPEWRRWLSFRKRAILILWRSERKTGGLRCHYCDRSGLRINNHQAEDEDCATLDHVVPVSKGGPRYSLSNIVVACKACNGKKADKSYQDFRKNNKSA